jgi:peptidoglycan-N-acetylglucosamine deacetylase
MRSSLATCANKLFPGIKFSMDSGEKALYLTFDDGPHPESTPIILDKLSKYNAKATFFCLGRNVEKFPLFYEMIISEGHETGNHTFSHPNGWLTGAGKYIADVRKAASLIGSRLFRPPYGRITPMQYLQLKKYYEIIMWTRQFADYQPGFNPATIKPDVIKGGEILVMHDSPATIQKALPLLDQVLGLNHSFAFNAI